MNLEFVCFFVAFEASEAAKFEDGQLAYLDILYLVQFTHMMEIAHKLLQLFQMWFNTENRAVAIINDTRQ